MIDKEQDRDGLDAFFDAARKTAPDADAAFLARVLDDALSVQAEAAPAPPARTPERAGVLRQVLRGLGGWPAVAGLAVATVAGIWIGVNPPRAVSDPLAALIGPGYTDDAESDYSLDPLTEFDIAMTEG